MALRPKQERFVNEYLIDMNATQAALRAGYSKTTAERASDWINIEGAKKAKFQENSSSQFNREIYDRIHELMEQKNKELIADQDEVLRYLTSVVRGKSRSSIVVIENIGDMTSEAREIEKAPDEKERLKAAELLGKAHGIFTEKIEQSVDMDLNITLDYGNEEE